MYLYAYILLLPLKLTFPLFTNLRVIKWIPAKSAAVELEKSRGQLLISVRTPVSINYLFEISPLKIEEWSLRGPPRYAP